MENTIQRVCPSCKISKPISEFYSRRKRIGNSSYCKICTNNATKSRQRELKKEAVAYLGGKCLDCGCSGHPAIFDFHHLDSSLKEFTIGHSKLLSLEKIKYELDKCILLCANCHRIRHAKY